MQRKLAASKRTKAYNEIMDAESSPRLFHKLIRAQRTSSTLSLVANEEKLISDDDICEGWARHLKSLAIPSNSSGFDVRRMFGTSPGGQHTHWPYLRRHTTHSSISKLEEITKATNRLHNNKTPDIMGMTSEHIKFAKHNTANAIREIINYCFEARDVPYFMKQGIVTPIFRKGDQKIPTT